MCFKYLNGIYVLKTCIPCGVSLVKALLCEVQGLRFIPQTEPIVTSLVEKCMHRPAGPSVLGSDIKKLTFKS